MTKEDVGLLTPGTRVLIGPRLMGSELFGWEDPPELEQFLGTVVTITRVEKSYDENTYTVETEENQSGSSFILEEIECIIPDEELEESDMDLSCLIGF